MNSTINVKNKQMILQIISQMVAVFGKKCNIVMYVYPHTHPLLKHNRFLTMKSERPLL